MTIVFGSVFATGRARSTRAAGRSAPDGVGWLLRPSAIKTVRAGMITWRWVGYNAIIFLAGLQAIPTDVFEAAKVDGANSRQIFFRVTGTAAAAGDPVRRHHVHHRRPADLHRVAGAVLRTTRERGGPGQARHDASCSICTSRPSTTTSSATARRSAGPCSLLIAVFAVINWRLVRRTATTAAIGAAQGRRAMAAESPPPTRASRSAPAAGGPGSWVRRAAARRAGLALPLLLAGGDGLHHHPGHPRLPAQAGAGHPPAGEHAEGDRPDRLLRGRCSTRSWSPRRHGAGAVLRLAGRLRLRQVRVPGQEGAVRRSCWPRT